MTAERMTDSRNLPKQAAETDCCIQICADFPIQWKGVLTVAAKVYDAGYKTCLRHSPSQPQLFLLIPPVSMHNNRCTPRVCRLNEDRGNLVSVAWKKTMFDIHASCIQTRSIKAFSK